MRKPDYTPGKFRDSRKPDLPVGRQEQTYKPVESRVGWLKKLWFKLNHKKRNIGIFLMGVGYLVQTFNPAGTGLVLIGGLLSGAGVAHDLKKKHDKKKEEGKRDWVDLLVEIINAILKIFKSKGVSK